jgi:hypothetical protein
MPRPPALTDTDPAAERVQLELLRRASVARKLELLGQLNDTVHVLAISGLRHNPPVLSDRALRRRLADLVLGEELARIVYGNP